MKNYQKGFVPILIIIVVAAVAVLGGGAYYATKNKSSVEVTTNTKVNESVNVPTSASSQSETSIVSNSTNTSKVAPVKKAVSNPVSISQNIKDIPEAEANLVNIIEFMKGRANDGKYLAIVAPTNSDVLESGKYVTVLFAPVKDASKYEITITIPDYNPQTGLGSGSSVTLFKKTTASTKLDILVPQTKALFVSESTYNGEELWVRALDAGGNEIAKERVQIKILPLPNQPQLVKVDKYVVPKEGGVVTLTFGTLPSNLKTRKVFIGCIGSITIASIDSKSCYQPTISQSGVPSQASSEQSVVLGAGTYTKKLIVKPNIYKDRDTVVDVRVQYYDAAGNLSKEGSSIFIKVMK